MFEREAVLPQKLQNTEMQSRRRINPNNAPTYADRPSYGSSVSTGPSMGLSWNVLLSVRQASHFARMSAAESVARFGTLYFPQQTS